MPFWGMLIRIPAILLALTVHEYCHARVARAMGDPTASSQGRMTLNPLSHIDPMGFLCLLLVGFGWAKPVPVNPFFFPNPRRGMMWSSAAGPLANLAAAVVCAGIFRGLGSPEGFLGGLLAMSIFYNITLALFNLLPIYPLDGSHVLKGLVSPKAAYVLGRYDRVFMYGLFGVILLDALFDTRLMGRLLMQPVLEIFALLGGKEALVALVKIFR
ncbi:MAG: site-2 protease family protein [bacterium]